MIPRGVWHQLGHHSQTLAVEVLQNGVGVGVVISPRDLTLSQAETRCPQYRGLNAAVLLDYQFYIPEYENPNLVTYSLNGFRASANTLNQLSQSELDQLSSRIEEQNKALDTSAVLAPAVLYEANRPDRLELNQKLFEASKRSGDVLGKPTIATVALANSTVVSPHSISDAIAHATSLQCDGLYYIFEFTESRIPGSFPEVLACGSACLTLAGSMKPVIHAYAGPMALLSFGFGASAAGVGHSQNLWQFNRDRWLTNDDQQGFAGKVAPRFFSGPLWGTVIYSDEVVRVPLSLRQLVMDHTPFSQKIVNPVTHGSVDWSRKDAGRHLVHIIGMKAGELAALPNARHAAQAAIDHLDQANSFFGELAAHSVHLKGESQNSHQTNWRNVLQKLLDERKDDYEFIELMSS